MIGLDECLHLARYANQRDEHAETKQIVVEVDKPNIVVQFGQHSFGTNRIECNKNAGHKSIKNAGRSDRTSQLFAVAAQNKSDDDHKTGAECGKRCTLPQQKVREDHVENSGKTSADEVERNIDVLKTQIVKHDHSNKCESQRNRVFRLPPRDSNVRKLYQLK